MKRTFRFLAMGLLAVGLLASCNKKENNNGNGFKAITEQNGGNSKTYGVLLSDTQLSVRWKADDKIKVSNGSETCIFQLTSGEGETSGEFNRLNGSSFDFTSGDFTAIYPVVNTEDVENTVGASTATFNLPATQTFDAEHPGSFAEKAMPMMAHATEQTLYFKNVLGGVCFPLVGDGLHVSKVVLTSNNTNDKLWGVFNANYTNDEPVLTYVSGGSNSITLNCDVTLNATNAVEFTIMVPPGTMESGFTMAAYDGEIEVYEKSSTPGAEITIHRNEILVSGDIPVEATNLAVTTISPTYITDNSAYGSGTVTVIGKEVKPITERGLCWALASVTTEPTLENSYEDEGQQITGTYGFRLDNLEKDQVYYVRAYAKNSAGQVVYGDAIPFATRKDYVNDYNGKIPFGYSVSDSKQVYFSMGNLQYQASTGTWRFAEKQYDYVGSQTVGTDATMGGTVEGSDNANVSQSYSGWVDLFAWGTSGCKMLEATPYFYQPWDTIQNLPDGTPTGQYYGPRGMTSLVTPYSGGDWGRYNAISNGGNIADRWHCMNSTPSNHFDDDPEGVDYSSNDGDEYGSMFPSTEFGALCEWYYLLHVRNQDYRFAFTQLTVEDGVVVNGVLLFPDNFTWPTTVEELNITNRTNTESSTPMFDENPLNEAEWSLLENTGAVFLPAAGVRFGANRFEGLNAMGRYWTTSASNANQGYNHARNLRFNRDVLNANNSSVRSVAYSVRLVQE